MKIKENECQYPGKSMNLSVFITVVECPNSTNTDLALYASSIILIIYLRRMG